MSAHNPSLRPWRDIDRRKCRQIMVGNVPVGGDAPVTVQTMTNTLTSDARATIDQIRRCEEAGVDIIRVSCPDVESTAAMKQIVRAAKVVKNRGDDASEAQSLHDLGYRARADQRNAQRAEGCQLGLSGEREAEQGCLVDVEIGVDLPKPP